MKMTRNFVLVFAMLAMFAAASTSVRAADWVDLLPDGDMEKHWTTEGNWKSDGKGAVELVPRPGEGGWSRWKSYLWLKEMQPADFEFEFEYNVEKGSNSGFYFHVGDMNDPVAKGIEVQIFDSHAKGDKGLNDHDSGGIIPGVPPKKNAAKPAGEWNKFHIAVAGDELTVKLNDVVVNQLKLSESRVKDRPKQGYIGFQDHALPLKLRNLRIKVGS
jgi:hypothetical protein